MTTIAQLTKSILTRENRASNDGKYAFGAKRGKVFEVILGKTEVAGIIADVKKLTPAQQKGVLKALDKRIHQWQVQANGAPVRVELASRKTLLAFAKKVGVEMPALEGEYARLRAHLSHHHHGLRTHMG